MQERIYFATRLFALVCSIATVAGCGGGSSEDSAQPVTLEKNSSGVTVTLKAGVIQVPESVSSTWTSATTLELSPAQPAVSAGKVFTLGDAAFYAVSVTAVPNGQSVAVRMSTQSEAIERLEIDGDLDGEALDLSRAAVEVFAREPGQLSGGARRQPLATAQVETTGSCSASRPSSGPQFDVSCSLGFKTDDKYIGGEASVDLREISVTKMKYSSATNPSAIAASFSAKATGKIELRFFPAGNVEDGKALEGAVPLGRVSLPIPGTFGFASLRFPLGVEYKAPVPPMSVGLTFSSEIVEGVGTNFAPTFFADGFEFSPSTQEISFAVDGYSRLFSGAELATTSLPQPPFTINPTSVSDIAVFGVYLKAGPKGNLSWRYRDLDGLNCVQATEMVGEQLLTAFANTKLNDLLGEAAFTFTQKLSSAGLPDYAFGSCLDSISPSPSSATIKVGQGLSVAAFMRAYHISGKALPLPEGMTYFASGGVIDAATGFFQAANPGTYFVTAKSPRGLLSSALTVTVVPDNPTDLPSYYHIAFQNIFCDTTAKVSFTLSAGSSAGGGGATFTPAACSPTSPSRDSKVSTDSPISLMRNTTYQMFVSFDKGTDLAGVVLTLELFSLDPYFIISSQYQSFVDAHGEKTLTFTTPP